MINDREKIRNEERVVVMTKNKSNVEVKRINANIPIKLANRVEEYANENMLNLTSAYITLLNQALNHFEMMKSMPMYSQLLQNPNFASAIQSTSNVNNEELIRMNDFLSKLTPEQMSKMIDNIENKD